MTYVVRASFKAKSREIRKGQIIAMPEDKAEALLKAGKIVELKPCHICGEHGWWLSARGVLACGVCHPPVPGAVKKWIGDPEACARMKAGKSAVILSWQEMGERKVTTDLATVAHIQQDDGVEGK